MTQSVNHPTVSDRLIIFTRYPQAGQAKTRLIPALGATGAAKLQRQMTEHLIKQFQPFCLEKQIGLQVHFAGGSKAQMIRWLGSEILLTPQCAGNLGQKLTFALTQTFTEGTTRAVIIGSDCPTLSGNEIDQALKQLDSHDVVLGPAADGGYYLIALRAMHRCLFENIPWGTDQVLATTQAIARHHQLSVAQLNVLTDIDRPEDLPLWEAQQKAIAASKAPVNQRHPSNEATTPRQHYRDALDESAG